VSAKHHQWVVHKLNDEYAVVNSKQFPFRFFSAYDVLGGLEKLANGEAPPPRRGAKKSKKKAKEPPEIDKSLLQKYKNALDNALKIATCYNVKPIPGSTLILCNVGSNMDRPCTAARGLGKPRKVLEVGVLLGLMCKYSCERSTMLVYGSNNQFTNVELEEGTILHNMEKVMMAASASSLTSSDGNIPFAFLTEMLVDRTQVDNIVLLTDAMKLDDQQGSKMMNFLKKYRHFVNPDLLFVSVDLGKPTSGVSSTITPEHPNDIYLAGYSDQILRFIAERGDSGQLTYVENIDKALNLSNIELPSLAEIADKGNQIPSLSSERAMLSAAQGQRWKTVRVFISSTFRDMHGERDLLTRFVFPELRARAYSRQIHVYEVDLRWGVTEQDTRSHKALEICLDEISRSQYFIGLLGQRYGWIQDEYNVPDTPRFDWLKELPTRKSITEVEMYHAALSDTDKAVGKAFFYFRDPAFASKVPKCFKSEFESESEESFEKIETLKSNIHLSGLEVYPDYPCCWLGEVQGKPMVGGLESFGKRVLYNLWNAIQHDYQEDDMEEPRDPIMQATSQHNAFAENRASSFIGRRQLLQKATTALESPDNKLVLVTGRPGCGKSAFMAAVAQELGSNAPADLVISHFIGAAPGSGNVLQLLTRLCYEMKRRYAVNRDIPDDYTDLARDWGNFLEESVTNLGNQSTKIIILIDGVDLLEDKHNGRSLDWIPSEIPDGVVLCFSAVEGGTVVTNLRKRKNPIPAEVGIGPLDMFDKAEMVRNKLQKHRKALDESPFNNQMKLLLTKKEAINPLFLHLACEELRFFGVFEEVTAYLKKMPTTISNLLQDILQRLEAEHTTDVLCTALLLLTVVRNGLLEYELTEVLQLALAELCGEREGSLPPMVFSKLLRSLQSFLQPTGEETADQLMLAHKDIEKAVKMRYAKGAASRKENQLHLLLATFFRAEADPEGNRTFKGKSVRAFTELPYHLMEAGSWKELEELVCNINFVVAKCQLGLAHQLLEDYMPATVGLTAAKNREVAKFIQQPAVLEYKSFVSRNLHIFLKSPSLALQQALNEPGSSFVGTASREAHQQETPSSMMMWLNKPDTINPCQMNISSQTGAVLCVAVSPDSSFFAAGYKNGAVKLYAVATGKEAHTFIGHAAGIIDVCFVGTGTVCSASHDTTLSLWDTKQGIRTATLKGHSRGVHGCAADKSGQSVVSVSWDTQIKVWEGKSGRLRSTLKTQGKHNTPINCVSFHPEGQLVVVGSWDASLRIWDTFNQKRLKVLKGHRSSIQACSYAPSGRHIVSAALDGEVKVWSTRSGTAVGTIASGHHSPVNGVSFTPNGQFLATASSDKVVKVWSGSLGQPISSIGSADLGFVHQVVLDHTTQALSVGYHDGHIRQFSIQTGFEMLAIKPRPSPVVGLAHHSNLHMVAFADGHIMVCDLTSPSRSISLQGHTTHITCALWGKNGLASASEDFCIFMWPHELNHYSKMLLRKQAPLRAGKNRRGKGTPAPPPASSAGELSVNSLVTLRTQHTGKISAISFSCDGTMLAAASHDRSVSLWSCITQQLIKVMPSCHKDWVTTCGFSDSSSNILLTGSSDFTLKAWDVHSLTTENSGLKTTFTGHTSAINSIAFSQGVVVSAGFDGSVKAWTHKGVEITTMYCHKQRVNTCLLHIPSRAKANQLASSWADDMDDEDQKVKVQLDEIMVITGSDDGTVGIWKPFLPNEITSLIGHSDRVLSVSSTLNNQLLTSSLDGSIRMWNPPLSSTTHPGVLMLRNTSKGHTGPVTTVSAMSAGQDLVFVASGGRDGYVGVWEVTRQTTSKLYQMKDSEKPISSVCFTASQANGSGSFVAGNDAGVLKYYRFDQKVFPNSTYQISAASLMGAQPISKLVLTEDRSSVVAGSWSNKVSNINISKKKAQGLGQQKDWVMDIVTSGQKVYTLGIDNTLNTWVMSDDGSSSKSFHSSKPLNLKTPEEHGPTHALSLGVVPGTSYLAVGDSKGKVSLWNMTNQRMELTKKLHGKQVNVVCPVSTQCFMTGSNDSTVKVWRVERKARVAHVTQLGQFYCRACVTAISPVTPGRKGEGEQEKPMFVVGDSLGHVTVLQWHQ
jgi:telomerase protein component 1